jgi:hypothetical protein
MALAGARAPEEALGLAAVLAVVAALVEAVELGLAEAGRGSAEEAAALGLAAVERAVVVPAVQEVAELQVGAKHLESG